MDDLLTLEDSVHYVRANVATIYPPAEHRGKTMGSIPVELHKKLQTYAKANKLLMNELLAGLWDFHEQYEATYADELKKQRATKKRR